MGDPTGLPSDITEFEKTIYKVNEKGEILLEPQKWRDADGNRGISSRWTIVTETIDEKIEIIGYYRSSGGYSEMVDRNGKITWVDEIGIEPSLISPIDILGPSLIVALGRSIGITAGRAILTSTVSAAGLRVTGRGVSGALAAALKKMVEVARALISRRAVQMVTGPSGSVARSTIEAAMKAGGSTIKVATRLTARPQVGRALSVAAGDEAAALAGAARTGGQIFTAEIPKALIVELEAIGLARSATTQMGKVIGKEYRFLKEASEFIVPFFK